MTLIIKIEMKWEEALTNVDELLLPLNDTKNSIYLIISVMPTGNWDSVILHKVASWLLETQVLSCIDATYISSLKGLCDCWILELVLLPFAQFK